MITEDQFIDILADNDPAEYPSVDAYVDAVKVCAEETTGSNFKPRS